MPAAPALLGCTQVPFHTRDPLRSHQAKQMPWGVSQCWGTARYVCWSLVVTHIGADPGTLGPAVPLTRGYPLTVV